MKKLLILALFGASMYAMEKNNGVEQVIDDIRNSSDSIQKYALKLKDHGIHAEIEGYDNFIYDHEKLDRYGKLVHDFFNCEDIRNATVEPSEIVKVADNRIALRIGILSKDTELVHCAINSQLTLNNPHKIAN